MCKIFSLVPSKKPFTRENWDKLSVYFSSFEWYNFQLFHKKPFGTWQFGKIGLNEALYEALYETLYETLYKTFYKASSYKGSTD